MARSSYSFERRRREAEKRRKKAEKAEMKKLRRERKAQGLDPDAPVEEGEAAPVGDEPETDAPPAAEPTKDP